jgi:hypothetical protein
MRYCFLLAHFYLHFRFGLDFKIPNFYLEKRVLKKNIFLRKQLLLSLQSRIGGNVGRMAN